MVKSACPLSALSPVPLLATQGIASAGLGARPHPAITPPSTIGENLIFRTPRVPRFFRHEGATRDKVLVKPWQLSCQRRRTFVLMVNEGSGRAGKTQSVKVTDTHLYGYNSTD